MQKKRKSTSEKRKPTYDLASIKAEFCTVKALRMTRAARDGAFDLGLSLQGVVDVIASMTREQFYKSMASHNDHRIWQDVYHVPVASVLVYVKFTIDDEGKLLISFKPK